MLLGHLAIPIILNHYTPVHPAPLVAGSLFPDVMDKSLKIIGLAPNSRTISHTALGLALSTAAIYAAEGNTAAASWGAGYLSHLLGDGRGFVPWWYPFLSYVFRRSQRTFWQSLFHALRSTGWLEAFLLLWAFWLVVSHYRPKCLRPNCSDPAAFLASR
jgi:hypothetical protein